MLDFYIVATLVAMTTGTSEAQIIPEDSTIWTAHENHIYYTRDTATWTDSQGTGQLPSIGQITIGNINNSFGLAYDHHSSQLVTSHPDVNLLALVFLDSSSSTVLYSGTSKDIGQMTIDWTARNLYWADGGYGWIAMRPLPDTPTFNGLEQRLKLVVDKHLDKPTGITVYPDKYYLFWSDAGVNPKIERSNLVGEERTVLAWHNLMSPTCITIDFGTDRLYWSDQSRGTIEYTDFDGNGRAVLASNPDYDFYGVAVFQDSLLYTAPKLNITGFYSLQENILGRSGHVINFTVPLYYVDVFDVDEQPRETLEGCDSQHIDCEHICVHAEQDRGASCYCYDGYTLHAGDGETCEAETKVLERHLLLTSGSSICSVTVTAINSQIPLPVSCDVVIHNDTIRVFALDMTDGVVFFASGSTIFRSLTDGSEPEAVLTDSGDIIDMDYDWKTKELFWIISGGRNIHYINTLQDPISVTKAVTSDITHIAVDPHNRNVYWIRKGPSPELYVWRRETDALADVSTLYLKKPTDLEYNRLQDSLIWNDASGYVGVINVDGTNERKYETATTGADRHAVAVFKKFLISTTAEDNRHIDAIYEPDDSLLYHITLQSPPELHTPILDMHVFDTTLQPHDLDPCEVDNGGCEHICVYGNDASQCSCYLGYRLQDNRKSCSTSNLDSDYFLVLDALNVNMYQIASNDIEDNIRSVATNSNNRPSGIAFDMKRSVLVWVDQKSRLVKKKFIKGSSETAIGTNVDESAQLAVDITSGNIYVTSGSEIMVIDEYDNVETIIEGAEVKGTVGKLELLPEKGRMVWVETGASSRLVMANMDGTSVKVIHEDSDDIKRPEDVAFDLEKADRFYWCDSGLGKIEEVMIASLNTRPVYTNKQLQPVALDVVGEYIFFILRYQRKIYRINMDGSGIKLVTESPLFGRLTHLYVSKPIPKDHSICGICNGGCSTICLPREEDKSTCSCEDGSSLLSDGKTCNTARRCEDPTADGLSSFSECCSDSPHAECKPVCQADYNLQYAYAVKCENGQWNASVGAMCESSSDKFPLAIVAGAAGGGAAVVIIVIVVVVVVCRRRGKRKSSRRPPLPSSRDVNPVANGRSRPYDLGDGLSPPQLPDRPLTKEEQDDGGEYHYLDESLVAKRVELPEERKKDVQRDRPVSGRYSRFPGKKDPYYLTPMSEFDPKPDYPTYGLDVAAGAEDDGYLAASSMGAASHMGSDFTDRDDGYLAASSLGAPSQRGSDFSDDGPYLTGGQSRGAMTDFMTSVPRDVNGRPADVPMAHFGHHQGTGSGLMPGFDHVRF